VPLALGLLLFSALASSSIPFTPQQDDLRSGYTPKGAPSRTELARYERFFRPAEERRKKREVLDLESQRRHLHQKNEGAGSEEPISLVGHPSIHGNYFTFYYLNSPNLVSFRASPGQRQSAGGEAT
jgi:hypothetical protein